MKTVDREAKLPQVVLARRTATGLARCLHRRQKQRKQHAHNRHHDEQFDKGKAHSLHIELTISLEPYLGEINARFAFVRGVVAYPELLVVPNKSRVTGVAAGGELEELGERARF